MKAFIFALTCLLLVTGSLHADPRQWQDPGVWLRHARSAEMAEWSSPVVDRDGNMLVVWSEERKSDRDIYAHIVGPDNHLLWDSAVAVVTEGHDQQSPMAAATPGGFVVAWLDFRSDPERSLTAHGGDVRAQKISIAGARVWERVDSTGVPVDMSASSVHSLLAVVPDQDGGAFVVWLEYVSNAPCVVAVQHLNASGVLTIPVTLRVTSQSMDHRAAACGDGAGNLLLAWMSEESAALRISKITPEGGLLWGGSGTVAMSALQYVYSYVSLCPDGQGGCFAGLADPVRPRLQHLDSGGGRLMGESGRSVPIATSPQTVVSLAPSVTSGGIDGCLLAEHVIVLDALHEIFAQKIGLDNVAAWGDSGRQVCEAISTTLDMDIVSDGSGGALITRRGQYHYSPSRISRISAQGSPVWSSCDAAPFSTDFTRPVQNPALRMQTGEIVVIGARFAPEYSSNESAETVSSQVLDLATGQRQLDGDGLEVLSDIGGDAEYSHGICIGGNKLLTWWRDEQRGFNFDAYQIVHEDGAIECAPQGTRLFEVSPAWLHASCLSALANCPDGIGGAYFASAAPTLNMDSVAVILTRIDMMGNRVGPAPGVVVTTMPADSSGLLNAVMSADGNGRCYIACSIVHLSASTSVRLLCFDAQLQPCWSEPREIAHSMVYGVTVGSSGGVVLVSTATVSGETAIVARSFNAGGDSLWSVVVNDSPTFDGSGIGINADRLGGCYISWKDSRRLYSQRESYVQHLAGDGRELWSHRGIPISSNIEEQSQSNFTVDSQGGLYCVWCGDLNRGLAQRIHPDGSYCWDSRGVIFSPAITTGSTLVATVDAHDHLTAAWRQGSWDYTRIFGIQLDSTGQHTDPYWSNGHGALVSDALGWARDPSLTATSDGSVFVTYSRTSTGDRILVQSIYAQLLLDGPTLAKSTNHQIPRAYALHPAFPNPFNPTCLIEIELAARGKVELAVYDVTGRLVTTLVQETLSAGAHTVRFDAQNLASGVYFCRLRAGTFSQTRKMLLLR